MVTLVGCKIFFTFFLSKSIWFCQFPCPWLPIHPIFGQFCEINFWPKWTPVSHDFSEFCKSVTRISVNWALIILATTHTVWGISDQIVGLTLIQILQAMLPTFSKISWLYCKHSETQIKYSVKIYLSFVKYFHFEMIKKCTIVKRNSKLVMKLQ